VIGRYGGALGVELVNPHSVVQIGTESLENAAHSTQQVIGFAPQRRPAAQAVTRRPFDFSRKPLVEVESFMTIEEHPRPRFHGICIVNGAADEAR